MSIFIKRGGKPVAVSIKKPVYAMATTDGTSAEITMYGDIYETHPTNWYGEPIEGQFVLLDEFLADLEKIAGCKDITIRMNSYGGDAGVSNTIHNRLRELVRAGTKLNCIVDGVAMSGGSLIMCACDTVRVNPSSLIMIHNAWELLWGGYNANQMRDEAARMDAWDKMQMEIYTRKTGLSAEEVLALMSETTYMTGREAAEKGYADEVIEDAEPSNIAASADRRSLFVCGRKIHVAPGMTIPESIPTVNPEASAPADNTNSPENSGSHEGGNEPMATTIEELRAECPELVAQIEAQARAAAETPAGDGAGGGDPVAAERQRIRDIDALAGVFDAATINEAKYGEHPCTAQEMVYQAAQKAAEQGRKFLTAMEDDTKDSGAQDVGASVSDGGTGSEADEKKATAAQAKADVKKFLEMKKGGR